MVAAKNLIKFLNFREQTVFSYVILSVMQTLESASPITYTNEKIGANVKENLEDEILVLLKSTTKGDKEAFTKFAEILGKRILTIAKKIINDKMYAEDVLNTVLFKVWQNSEKIIKLKNPVGYINTIAYNAAIDIKRKKTELPLFDNVPCPIKDNDAKMDMEEALSFLDKEAREIVLYHIHANYSFQKIGMLLGFTKKAVYLKYQKAIGILKNYLKNEKF